MNAAEKLDEIRRGAEAVAWLAQRCQDDVSVSVRLADGRVLAPTGAVEDWQAFQAAQALLAEIIEA